MSTPCTQKNDVAYASEQLNEVVKRCKMINNFHHKGYRNRPLTDNQKKSNALKSKTRQEWNTYMPLWKNQCMA